MNRGILTLVMALMVGTTGMAQHRLSTALKQELALANDRDMFRVQLVLTEKADLEPLRQRFVAERMSVAQRAQLVSQHLTAHADAAQQPVLTVINDYARTHPALVDNIDRLWIANVITLDASKALILQLSAHPSVQTIDLDGRWRIRPIEPVKAETEGGQRSVGGVEPGLEAIGARFMWNMGYTGRNRIAYTLDTGIWPDHPSIRDNFLYHRYPLERTWFAYDSRFPADKTSSHGTHCTGTMVGLDPATADTIGVAFNAYFIASDPVVSNLAFLKPLTDFLHAFEWALDPDGDPATLNDVPDVINNSWGFDPPADTLLCESVVADMLTAVEIAGIANVFAAGNDGPGPMTVGTPNYVNTGMVNSFTVGALNANTPALAIANFSSRGPSPCGGGGSIAIKPEVSAPGVSVRSCVGQDAYSFYSGTSMASPHVAGAVLLLKEAFPMASGEEVLLALYHSAIDLGDVGEDNTFGMGIISLENAFNLLSETFPPQPPLTDEYDLAMEVTAPNGGLSCETSITPMVRLHNRGQQDISGVNIAYGQVGQAELGHTWTGTIASGEHADVQLATVNLSGEGFTEVWFRAEMELEVEELDRHNNSTVLRFFRRMTETLPFVENFETVTFDDDRWLRDNPDGSNTWDTLSIEGPIGSTTSAYMSFYSYSPRQDQQDAITSPLLPIGDATIPSTLKFDRFYTFFHQNFSDSLRISVSADCGLTWSTVFYKGGLGLASHESTGGNRWPQSVDEWLTEYVDISAFSGEDILIRFLTTNRKGNHFLLDNIWVYSGPEPAGIHAPDNGGMTVYPNPGNGDFRFSGWKEGMNFNATVTDIQGRTVSSGTLSTPVLHLGAVPAGLYHVRLDNGTDTRSFRVVKVD